MALQYACQPFITIDDVIAASCGCDVDEAEDAELIELMIDQASDILAVATGGEVAGTCTVTVRPIALCGGNEYWSQFPTRDWTTRFGGINTIPLRGPNVDVVEILIDGAVVPISEYGLVDNRFLFRRAGCWPTENDIRKASSEVGTFEITYRFGRLDKLGKMAATELTCELLRDILGKPTSLPRGVVAANVQGASLSVRNRAEALREGDEQIPVVSRFLSLYAPDGPNMVASVWAPELEQFWSLVEVEGPSGS